MSTPVLTSSRHDAVVVLPPKTNSATIEKLPHNNAGNITATTDLQNQNPRNENNMTAATVIAGGFAAAAMMSGTCADAKPATRNRNLFAQRGFVKLVSTELKVWSRDVGNLFWALLFPAGLLLLNALMGGDSFTEVMGVPYGHHWYGLTPLNAILPMFLAIAAGIPFLTMLPVTFGGFREKGVLKRFSGSPMSSGALIGTHYLLNLAAVLVGSAIMLVVAAVAWGITMPDNIGLVALGFVLATAAMAAIGTLVASRAAKGSTANVLGQTIFFILMFAGGIMGGGNETLHAIARFSPMGAAAQIMEAGWFSTGIPTTQLLVLVAWTVLALPLGVKLFKWR